MTCTSSQSKCLLELNPGLLTPNGFTPISQAQSSHKHVFPLSNSFTTMWKTSSARSVPMSFPTLLRCLPLPEPQKRRAPEQEISGDLVCQCLLYWRTGFSFLRRNSWKGVFPITGTHANFFCWIFLVRLMPSNYKDFFFCLLDEYLMKAMKSEKESPGCEIFFYLIYFLFFVATVSIFLF